MDYILITIKNALKDVINTKRELEIRTNGSCSKEIRKIHLIEKQLERFIYVHNNKRRSINLKTIDYKDILEHRQNYKMIEIAEIYNVSISGLSKFMKENKLNNLSVEYELIK